MTTATADVPAIPPPSVALGDLYEVVDGEFREKPPMGAFEFELASVLQDFLSPFATSRGLGRIRTEMLFDLGPAVARQRRPDVAFVSAEKWPLHLRVPKTAAWAVIPDLAIEIISPSNPATDVAAKVDEYFRAGTKLVWVVYPNVDKVYVHQSPKKVDILARGDELDGGTVLPGFRLSIDDLFGPPADPA